jgi:hypothetical protein
MTSYSAAQRGSHETLTLKPSRKFVVHAGDESFPLSGDVEAIGIADLLARLRIHRNSRSSRFQIEIRP